MKKVDVIRPGSLNAIIGPSGTLKRILKNRDYFQNRGYNIEVFTYDNITDSESPIKPANVNKVSHSNNFFTVLKSKLRIMAAKSKLLAILFINKKNRDIKKLLSCYLSLNRNPDIVVFHSVVECYYYLLKKKEKRSKVVVFYHSEGIPLKMLLVNYPVLRDTSFAEKLLKIDEYVANHADQYAFISKNGQENFLKYYPNVSKEQTKLIVNGIEDITKEEASQLLPVPQNITNFKYRLCCTGSINIRKGHRIILESLCKIEKSILSNIHVTFIGDGPERFFLEKFVRENEILEHVRFLGRIDNSQVYKYLFQANIFILMSKNEGLPISIIEAMRAGLPIISTKVAGIPELINEGENGFLLDPDADQLTSLLNDIDSHNWVKMGKVSRNRFLREFTFDRMKSEYCDMLDIL